MSKNRGLRDKQTVVIVFTPDIINVVGVYGDEAAADTAIFESGARGNVLAVTFGPDKEGKNYIKPLGKRFEPFDVDIRA